MSNLAYGVRGRTGESQRQFLHLEADHRNLQHTGRHVEVERRPAAGGGNEHHARVRVDDHGVADGGEHRCVVHAVGVGVALAEVDAVTVGPLGDRCELARRPHERTVERSVVRAVGRDPVSGRDDVVEAEAVGERLHQVVRRRGGEHDRSAGGSVGREGSLGERLHHRTEIVGDRLGRRPHRRLRAALGEADRLASQRHRRQRLADGVEQPVDELLARHGVGADQTGEPHGSGEHLAGCATEQRAVEVEEGSGAGRAARCGCRRGRRGGHRVRLRRRGNRTRKTGKTRMGDPGLSTWECPPVGGTGWWTSLRVEHGGCSHCDLLVKVCT